jgi:hypothetical protein
VLIDPAIMKTMFPGTGGVYRQEFTGMAVQLSWANVQEGARLGRAGSGFDQAFAPGLGRFAQVRVIASELAEAGIVEPAFGDTLTVDSVTWRVEQIRPEGGMWLLSVSSDQRWGR